MKQPSSHQIPQDMRLRGSSPIQNVSEYIGRVNQYLQIYPGNVPVYRGEPKIYEKPCVPNLYRGNLLGENRFLKKVCMTPCGRTV